MFASKAINATLRCDSGSPVWSPRQAVTLTSESSRSSDPRTYKISKKEFQYFSDPHFVAKVESVAPFLWHSRYALLKYLC
ncbi:hypothetical protein AVEN_244490-1, partial [Araneus ventricosus]